MRELSQVGGAYGAQMGRTNNVVNKGYPIRFEVARLEWVDGDYDQGGAYWGRTFDDPRTHRGSDFIFRFEGESDLDVEWMFVRAKTLTEAKKAVVDTYPNATFSNSVDLDTVVAGYTEAAIFFTTFEIGDDEDNREEVDGNDYDLSEEAARHFRAQCAEFIDSSLDLVEAAMAKDMDGPLIGHNLWLSGTGAGTGFWDRGLGELGDQLHEAAQSYGDDLYIGDDGLIHAGSEYLSEPEEVDAEASANPAP